MRTAAWITGLSVGSITLALAVMEAAADASEYAVVVVVVGLLWLAFFVALGRYVEWVLYRPYVPLDQRPVRYRSFWRYSYLLRFRLWLRRYPDDPHRARGEVAPALWNGLVSRLPTQRFRRLRVPRMRPRHYAPPRWVR